MKRKPMTLRHARERSWKLDEGWYERITEKRSRDMVADLVAWRGQLLVGLVTTKRWYERFLAFAEACERCGRE